jgi:hypothetical protein
LRKLFGTMRVSELASEAEKVSEEFVEDLTEVVREVSPSAVVQPGPAEVSGFSQGAYFQVWVRVSGLPDDGWRLLGALMKRGYRAKS